MNNQELPEFARSWAKGNIKDIPNGEYIAKVFAHCVKFPNGDEYYSEIGVKHGERMSSWEDIVIENGRWKSLFQQELGSMYDHGIKPEDIDFNELNKKYYHTEEYAKEHGIIPEVKCCESSVYNIKAIHINESVNESKCDTCENRDKILSAVKELKSKGDLDTNIEVAEHVGDILKTAGLDDSFDNMEKYRDMIDDCLEEVFGLKLVGGYFVGEAFKPVSKRSIISMIDDVLNEKYYWEEDDDDDDSDSGEYWETYRRKPGTTPTPITTDSLIQRFNDEPFVKKEDAFHIEVYNNTKTERILALRYGTHYSNGAYNGSQWTVYKLNINDEKTEIRTVPRKTMVLNIIKNMPEYSEAYKLLKK